MTKEDTNLPPMIVDWITALFNTNTPVNIRENYRDNLDRVAKIAQEAVAKFDRERFQKPRVAR